jgi:hypothetical protein
MSNSLYYLQLSEDPIWFADKIGEIQSFEHKLKSGSSENSTRWVLYHHIAETFAKNENETVRNYNDHIFELRV